MTIQPLMNTIENPVWKILVIDDDEDDFLIVRDMLRQARGRKFEVHWASTYTAGEAELRSDHYNAVLVDYDLGLHSGIDLIREAKSRGYEAPLVLFTGRGSYEVDVEAMGAGATMYLTKGEVNPLLLERAIRYAIEIKHRENDLREARETAERELAERKRAEAELRRSEATLRQSETKLRAVFEALVEGVVLLDPQGRVVEANSSIQRHGNTLSELTDPELDPRYRMIHPDGSPFPEEDQPAILSMRTGQAVRDVELGIVQSDGSVIWRLVNAQPVYDEMGALQGAVVSFFNITERKQAEQALKKAEERFAKAFHSSPAALAITRAADGAYIEVNASLCQVTGYQRSELIGHTALELGIYANAAERTELIRLLKAQGAVGSYELAIRTKSGLIRTILGSYDLIELDNEPCMIATLVDITERKQAEEQARQSLAQAEEGQQTLEALMAYIPEGITIAEGPDATIRMVSRYGQEMLGSAHDQMTAGQVASEWKVYQQDGRTLMPTEDLPLVRAIQRGEVVKNQALVQVNAQGQKLYLSCNAGPIRDAAGSITGGIVSWREISDLKRTEAALQESKDLLERLIQGAPAGIAFMKGPDFVYTLANEEYMRFARGKGELIGRTVAAVWPELASVALPQYMHVFQTGESVSVANAPFTILRSGVADVDYYTYTLTPIYKADGTIEGVMTLALDTTQAVLDRQSAEAQTARLAAVLEALPVGVWITDAAGRIIGKNDQADQIWAGYAPMVGGIDEYHEYPSWDARSGRKLETEDFPLTRVLKTGQPVAPEEHRIRRYDGSDGYVLVSAVPIEDREGHLAGAVAINLDITARKQAEQALQLSEERYRAAIINAPAVYAQTDRELRYQWIYNPHPDFQPEDVIGKRDDELGDNEDMRRLAARKQQVLDSGVGLREELVFHLSDGMYTYDMTIEPLRDPQGQIVGVTTAAFDITRRKHAEQALRESEENFRQLADAMPQLVWTARADGTVDYYNQRYQEYAGIAPVNGSEWVWGPVLHPDDLQPTLDAWNRAVETGTVYQFEHRVRMADGSYCWHLSRGIPVKDAAGRVVRWYGTATNIHAQKEIEEKIRQSNQELEQFAFIASHDLQEPLRKIIMFGSSLRSHLGTGGDKTVEDYLGRMESAAERMQIMIQGLLDLSRINARGETFAPVDLNQVVNEAVSDLETRIRAAEAQVTVGELPTIEADEQQMRRLFQNLIGNAIKFQPPDASPVIRISAALDRTSKPQTVILQVEDNGIGFEQGYAERVFQPFQRLHGKTAYEGSGLGLAICKKIVERHHGKIEARSSPGEGAKFIITLPIKQASS